MTVSPSDRLDSWKEIAAYLGRSVRTVRRWEAEEGLPVHRHMHRVLGSVYGYKSEIDQWRQSGEAAGAPAAARPAPDAVPVKAIAVLPFANLSSDPAHEYFADALTSEVISDLSKVLTLRVISRTSSMALKGTRKDVKAIGRELGVRYVVEGTVHRDGARLRMSAQLIDAVTDDHLWSEKYDGTLEDVFAIQERLARTIVSALEVQLTADEHGRLAARPIRDVHAYECYLQARQEALRWRADAIDRAVQLLRNGLAIVGENAELHAALGRAFLQYREAGIDFGPRPLEEAQRCVARVFALDPEAGAAVQLRGWVRYSSGRIREAVADLERALPTDPGDPDTLALLSNCYLISGRAAQARPLIARLLAIDPLTPLTRCMPGWADILEGQFAAALGPYREMFEMDPGNPMARLFYVWVLALNGAPDEARAVAGNFPPQVADTIPARVAGFLSRAFHGDRDGALAMLTPEIEHAARATDLFPRFLADGYALAGVPDRAIHWLTAATERGFINYPYLAQHDPFLQPLRERREFHELMAVVRRRWEAFPNAPKAQSPKPKA